jgi:hypothetical protein
MSNALSDKENFRQAIEAYAVARTTGNQLLSKAGVMLVEQWLSRLPDTFPEFVPPTKDNETAVEQQPEQAHA